jgi:hypothetical protein
VKNGNNLQSSGNQFTLGNSYFKFLDERAIKQVESLGYLKDYIIKWLINNELNYATASYYLFNNYDNEY